jgi:hypothetical protein
MLVLVPYQSTIQLYGTIQGEVPYSYRYSTGTVPVRVRPYGTKGNCIRLTMTYVLDRSPHVLFSARRVKISACVTVASHSCVILRPHPTFLAGEFSQQPSVSISRQHAWNNHPPDRACTLRRHFQQPLLAAAALLHPDCYYVWASTAGWLPQYRWLRLLARAAYSWLSVVSTATAASTASPPRFR